MEQRKAGQKKFVYDKNKHTIIVAGSQAKATMGEVMKERDKMERWVNIYRDTTSGERSVSNSDRESFDVAQKYAHNDKNFLLETVRLLTKEESDEYERLKDDEYKRATRPTCER